MFFAPSAKKLSFRKTFPMLKPKSKFDDIGPAVGGRPAEVKVKTSKNKKTARFSDFHIFYLQPFWILCYTHLWRSL